MEPNNMAGYDVDKELDDLHRALESGSKPAGNPVLQVNDLSEVANRYLSASARYDLSQKALFLTVKLDEGKFAKAVYFSTTVEQGDEERAVQYLAPVFNDLSRRGLIHSCLAPISSIVLAGDSSRSKSAVFCFVLIPEESVKEVENMYPEFVMQEGDIGRELYDLSPILSDGEFLTTIRVNACPINSPEDYRALFQRQLEQYLAVLPKGTSVRKVTQLAIQTLAIDFEVKFHSRLLNEVKRVEIDYRRAVAKISETHIEQFNVFRGIKYFDKNGQEIYK